mgnify:CR=1
MNFVSKVKPEWPLRLGLGFMYIYSGYDLFYHPTSWYWAIPKWFSQIVTSIATLELYLQLQGVGEFIMGCLLLAWFLGRRWLQVVSVLAVIEFAGILIFTGIGPITFRDIGLLGAALALFIISLKSDFNSA